MERPKQYAVFRNEEELAAVLGGADMQVIDYTQQPPPRESPQFAHPQETRRRGPEALPKPDPAYVQLEVTDGTKTQVYGCYAYASAHEIGYKEDGQERNPEIINPQDGTYLHLFLSDGQRTPALLNRAREEDFRLFQVPVDRDSLEKIMNGYDPAEFWLRDEPIHPIAEPVAEGPEPAQTAEPAYDRPAPAARTSYRDSEGTETGFFRRVAAEVLDNRFTEMLARPGGTQQEASLPRSALAAVGVKAMRALPAAETHLDDTAESLRPVPAGPAIVLPTVAKAGKGPKPVSRRPSVDSVIEAHLGGNRDRAAGLVNGGLEAARDNWRELSDKRKKQLGWGAAVAVAAVALGIVVHGNVLGGNKAAADETAATGSKQPAAGSWAWTPPTQPLSLGSYKVKDHLSLDVPYSAAGSSPAGWYPGDIAGTKEQYYVADKSTWQVAANVSASQLVSVESDGGKLQATVDLSKIALTYTPVAMTSAETKNVSQCSVQSVADWTPSVDQYGFIDCGNQVINIDQLAEKIKNGFKSPITVAQAQEINSNLQTLTKQAGFDTLNKVAASLNIDRTQLKQFTTALEASLKQAIKAQVAQKQPAKKVQVTFENELTPGTTTYLHAQGKEQLATSDGSLQVSGIKGALTDYDNATVTKAK